jgi:hypothetical protein
MAREALLSTTCSTIKFMKAKIEKYLSGYNCHEVTDEKNQVRMMDVMVAGDFPEDTDPESLVGETVYYDYEHPWIAIAQGVSIIPSNAKCPATEQGEIGSD